MTNNNNSYFALSGLLSLLFFLLMLVLFAFALVGAKKAKSFALKKDVYVSVNLNHINTPKKIVKKENKTVSKKIINKKVIEKKFEPKSKASNKTKSIDLNSLFSNVQAQKIVHQKVKPKVREINKRFEKSLSKDTQKLSKNHNELIQDKVKKIELSKDKITMVNQNASTGQEVDKYLAKLQAFVYQHFFPPSNSEGSSVKVRINIDKDGKMLDFRVLVLSNNDLLNNEIDSLKSSLENLNFPRNPDGGSMTIDIILTAQK